MGIKLGPKLELSFWAIGYIIIAVVLLIINISWIAGSLSGVVHGMKERNVFLAETNGTSADYVEAINRLIKDPALDKPKREALMARAARLNYNLGKIDDAHNLWAELKNSANPDVKTCAAISLITLELEGTKGDEATRLAGAKAALEKLNGLAAENPNSTDLLAARGAVLMYWFGGPDENNAIDQVRKIVEQAKAQEKTNPGNVEARRNLLLMQLALKNYDPPATDEAAQQANDWMRLEARRIAPYIKDVQKSPAALVLEEVREKAKDGALGEPTLNKLPGISGLTGQEFSHLVNTVAPYSADAMSGPNASKIFNVMVQLVKRASATDGNNAMNYGNIAALDCRWAAVQNETLNKVLDGLRSRSVALPAPFGNAPNALAEINMPLAEMEKALADAYSTLNGAVANANVPADAKANFCRRMVDISLWRAAIVAENARKIRYNEALSAANLWLTFEPKSTDMMLATAQIYELLGDSDNQAKWIEKLKAAGVNVSGVGPVANKLDFVTFYPGNPLQVGTSDCVVRDQVVLIGCTFVVTGYTNPVDENTVKVTLNGTALKVKSSNGLVYAMVQASKLTPQNKLDFKLALSPQLQKTASTVFKFDNK